jgi:hypothetical protein
MTTFLLVQGAWFGGWSWCFIARTAAYGPQRLPTLTDRAR